VGGIAGLHSEAWESTRGFRLIGRYDLDVRGVVWLDRGFASGYRRGSHMV